MDFKKCDCLNIDLKNWNTDDCLAMVYLKNINYIKYAKEHKIKYSYDNIIGQTTVLASKTNHPDFFDGSLE